MIELGKCNDSRSFDQLFVDADRSSSGPSQWLPAFLGHKFNTALHVTYR
jgi:hypothetical protein